MIVPMLTVGAERTFRVGGIYPDDIPKRKRAVESHIPAEEILMKSGDLLTFNGGKTAHSMYPAAQDPNFNANGYEYRISILFRWTTGVMRTMGPNRMNWSLKQIQQHEDEYCAAQVRWMAAHQAQSVLF
jgi:hypothetical protein